MANGSAIKIVSQQPSGNAAIVARAYEALNAGDITTLVKLFDANSSWHTPGRGAIAGSRMGRDSVFAQFDRYGRETGGTFRADLLNVLESDDGRVVAVHHNSAERNGTRSTFSAASSSSFGTAASSSVVSISTTSTPGIPSGHDAVTRE